MKNRFLIYSFILLITVSGLVACSHEARSVPVSSGTSTSDSPTSDTPISSSPTDSISPDPSEKSPMDEYRAVLQNENRFYSVGTDENLYISEINKVVSDDSSVKARISKFAIADLEGDDVPEVVLWITVNEDTDFGFEILSYKDGIVYGYTLWYRAFMELKEDGTFSFSGGTADNGFGRIQLTDKGYTIDQITYCESSVDSENNTVISYYVNGESATVEEFNAAIDEQDLKPDVTWYDFTDENISKVIG